MDSLVRLDEGKEYIRVKSGKTSKTRNSYAPVIARVTPSVVPPVTSTEIIVVGYAARLSSPISPAGTANRISDSFT